MPTPWVDRKIEPRRWRAFPRQPEQFFDWPCTDLDDDGKRYLESPADPIICYDSCNGYSLWSHFEPPPPAEMWITMPPRPRSKPETGRQPRG